MTAELMVAEKLLTVKGQRAEGKGARDGLLALNLLKKVFSQSSQRKGSLGFSSLSYSKIWPINHSQPLMSVSPRHASPDLYFHSTSLDFLFGNNFKCTEKVQE